MKKPLLILLTLATAFTINGQSNLEFNQNLFVAIQSPGVTVPEGKSWKIEASSNGEIFINNIPWVTRTTTGFGNLPVWVPGGTTIIANGNNDHISVLEFNITPVSSSNSSGSSSTTATSSVGEYVSLNDNLYTQVSSQSENMTYVESLNYCSQLVEGGFDDWILGNYQQWESYIANTTTFPTEGTSSWVRIMPSIQNYNPPSSSAFGGTYSRTNGFVILLDANGYGQFYPYNHAVVRTGTPILENGNSYSCRCLR